MGITALTEWVEEGAVQRKLRRAVRERGHVVETQRQLERRVGVEIKGRVSFRRKRIKLYTLRG